MTEGKRRSGNAHHLLFGAALVLLIALAAWWIVLMSRTIGEENGLVRERLRLQAVVEATLLASSAPGSLSPGPLEEPEGFEIVEAGPGVGAPIGATGLAVRATSSLLATHARRLRRQRIMVLGEGSMMLLLVAACVLMLHRLVLAERRYRRDIEHFLSRVTHEMKTPLAGVKALLESLREGRVPAERLPQLAALGLRQAERQEHLIENLLTAQRFGSGTGATRQVDLDLASLLEAFLAHRRESMALEEDRHVLRCPEGLRVRGDSGAILTILDNLADNADKYGARRLEIGAERAGERVLLVVRDDGQGFEPEQAAALFEAFRRGASAGPAARHGTGLGLHISRELAREMGGELSAASAGPGRGASFTLSLPAATGGGEAA